MLISTGAKKGGTDKYLTFMHNENCQKIGIREGLPQPDKEHLPKKKRRRRRKKNTTSIMIKRLSAFPLRS